MALLLSSCARIQLPEVTGVQTGLASWYGADFHGRPTSSKEIFNMYDLTAAHRTLPFGTRVMVINLKNGKSVVVRINDRGPFVRGRIIDLSYAAARAIDMVKDGVVPVRLEILEMGRGEKAAVVREMKPRPTSEIGGKLAVQVGAFINRANAERLTAELRQRSFKNVMIVTYKTRQAVYYRVRIPCRNRQEAEKVANRLIQAGYTPIIFGEGK
jgi:rare lipoprotein A